MQSVCNQYPISMQSAAAYHASRSLGASALARVAHHHRTYLWGKGEAPW
jgi:hypothetical protein